MTALETMSGAGNSSNNHHPIDSRSADDRIANSSSRKAKSPQALDAATGLP
jgi:hypothetical protein